MLKADTSDTKAPAKGSQYNAATLPLNETSPSTAKKASAVSARAKPWWEPVQDFHRHSVHDIYPSDTPSIRDEGWPVEKPALPAEIVKASSKLDDHIRQVQERRLELEKLRQQKLEQDLRLHAIGSHEHLNPPMTEDPSSPIFGHQSRHSSTGQRTTTTGENAIERTSGRRRSSSASSSSTASPSWSYSPSSTLNSTSTQQQQSENPLLRSTNTPSSLYSPITEENRRFEKIRERRKSSDAAKMQHYLNELKINEQKIQNAAIQHKLAVEDIRDKAIISNLDAEEGYERAKRNDELKKLQKEEDEFKHEHFQKEVEKRRQKHIDDVLDKQKWLQRGPKSAHHQ